MNLIRMDHSHICQITLIFLKKMDLVDAWISKQEFFKLE